jgi:hypothetical protein
MNFERLRDASISACGRAVLASAWGVLPVNSAVSLESVLFINHSVASDCLTGGN